MSDIVIKAEHLSKYYNLGVINNGTFFRDVQTWWALKRGKQDPHSQLDSHKFDNNNGFWALKDLNFDIHQGDRVGIIGKNGAGKSTLLKILSRITAPTEGDVKIRGRIASLLEVGTGFHAELTGRENIYLNGAILGMKRREVTRKLDEIIAFSEIEKHIDTPVKRYSSGMYVRLAFAVAAHLDSEILIADEVLAVGDATFQKKALGKMNELSTGQGRTVLFVSHQIPAVVSLCDKGMFLEQGKLIENGNLNKCVDLYFNRGISNDKASWNGSIKNEYLNITRTRIRKDKMSDYCCNEYEKGEIIFLDFDYEIFISSKLYVFAIEIVNTKGNTVCVNSASDYFDKDFYNQITSIGKHSLNLEIDSSIFGAGEYYIKFDIAIHNVQCFTKDEPILSFKTVLPPDKLVFLEADSRKNTINPTWKWSFT